MTGVAADRRALIEGISTLAERAGVAVMGYFDGGFTVERKADSSPVTEADRAADRIILDGLGGLAPAIPAITEEEVAEGRIPDVSGGRFWLVDPLDGTKEFIAGRREFTVNIALVENGRPVLGAVFLPAQGMLYVGGPEGASCRARGGTPRQIRVRSVPADGLSVLVSRSHASKPEIDRFLAPLPVRERVVAGSSLKFCWIAEGRADLYPRFGPTCEWDTAAGHAVLAAAGGSVRTLDGVALSYGKQDFLNPDFIARGADAEAPRG